jgi:hypothetical protein
MTASWSAFTTTAAHASGNNDNAGECAEEDFRQHQQEGKRIAAALHEEFGTRHAREIV